MLLVDAPQAAVEPEPEPQPLPEPDEPVIDDTQHDKEVIEHQNHDQPSSSDEGDSSKEGIEEEGATEEQPAKVDEHPNAVVPNGHPETLPPATTDPIAPTQIPD